MKILLVLSLILNLVLAVLYYQEKQQPPLERIVLENQPSTHKETSPEELSADELMGKKVFSPKISSEKEEEAEVDPLEMFSEEDFELIADDLNEIRKDFHGKLGLSEDLMQKKEQLMQEYLKQSGPIYAKGPLPFNLSFDDRRKLIDLEEKLYRDLEQLYGKEKWAKYKSMVDSYNGKVLEGHMRGESSSVMMSY